MCTATAAHHPVVWWWQTFSNTSDKWSIRFLSATLIVNLWLLEFKLLLRVVYRCIVVMIHLIIQNAWACIVQNAACHRGVRRIILGDAIGLCCVLSEPILDPTFHTVADGPTPFLDLHRVLIRVLRSIIGIFAGIILLLVLLLVCVMFADYI
jgi:hypothetical protein